MKLLIAIRIFLYKLTKLNVIFCNHTFLPDYYIEARGMYMYAYTCSKCDHPKFVTGVLNLSSKDIAEHKPHYVDYRKPNENT